MLELLLILFCAYSNAQLAKRKGQNTVLWGFITIVSFMVTYVVGGSIMVMMMYKGPLDPSALRDYIFDHPLMVITIMFMGLGGYLLVRYFLEKMPGNSKDDQVS